MKAVVVGAKGGIGRVIVEHLRDHEVHYEVTALDVDECDLRDDASVATALAGIGGFDVLVHTAGVSRDAVVWKLPVEDWDLVHDVNLRGAFLLMRHAIPIMRERGGGSIVLIGSINGSRGKRGTSAYSASKAGLIGLMRSVAREVGRFGIRVNVVEPGWVRTPLTDSLPAQLREAALAETALGELVEPADVAEMVAFLASDRARRITGQVFRVDAGQFIG
ncbi:MAG TPA: SDR family NAD(P)-dependent oxidoreductase [Thermoanaerobaculia bacterium]